LSEVQLDQKLLPELERVLSLYPVLSHGVADLRPARDFLVDGPGPEIPFLPRAISVMVRFPSAPIELLADGPSRTYLYYYRVMNRILDEIGVVLNNLLETRGYRAIPVPASKREGRERLGSLFPHKVAARLAGLGWLGKSGLIVTREAGPRVRLVTVLTDAPLSVGAPMEDYCGDCTECIEHCPAGALRDRKGDGDWRGNQVEPAVCHEFLDKQRDRYGMRICGLCVLHCPWGRRGSE
jgi:epoxyqueuosine reductase QueG